MCRTSDDKIHRLAREKCTAGGYPPGAIVKPLKAAAGLCYGHSVLFAAAGLGLRDCALPYETPAMNESLMRMRDSTGNPAPLGLLGFGMTTVLLNLHNAGFYELNTMILAMGICYGGAAQVIAGIMEWKKGNTFATTAFISYGFFWLSLVTSIILTKLGWATPSNPTAMGAYLAMWGIFTAVMFIATFSISRALQVVFGSLTLLFFLLAIGDWTHADPGYVRTTGYEGIFCGLSAMYTGLAIVLNELAGRIILPLGLVDR
jgi:uncharacterized protein